MDVKSTRPGYLTRTGPWPVEGTMHEDKRKQKTAKEIEDDRLAGISGGVERISGPVEKEERPDEKKQVLDSRLG